MLRIDLSALKEVHSFLCGKLSAFKGVPDIRKREYNRWNCNDRTRVIRSRISLLKTDSFLQKGECTSFEADTTCSAVSCVLGRSHQPVVVRKDHSLDAVSGVDFGQNMRHMGFDRGQGDEELVRDLLIAQAMGDFHQHLTFAICE